MNDPRPQRRGPQRPARYDPGPTIAHAGGITIATPDLATSLWFFRDVFGMEVTAQEDDVAYLRGYQERVHHSLVLRQRDAASVETMSLRVSRPQDVELFHDQFVEEGLEVRHLTAGTETGRGEAIRFLLPGGGHPLELYYDIERPLAPDELRSRLHGNSSRRRGLGVQRIDHLNVQTSAQNMGEAESWLRESLGLKRREAMMLPDRPDVPMVSWLSANSKLHDIAIGSSMTGQDAQFHHVAFSLESLSDVLTAVDQMRDLGIQVDAGPGKHGVGQGLYLYLRDPGSGYRVELYAGGYSFFDPDEAPLEWWPQEFGYALTWYGDNPMINPSTTYLETMSVAGLDRTAPPPAGDDDDGDEVAP